MAIATIMAIVEPIAYVSTGGIEIVEVVAGAVSAGASTTVM